MGKPKIRFKGYEDDWEQRKVTDLGEIYIGLVTTMTEHYTDKGHLLIRNSDIKDGYFEFGENPIYLDEEFSEQNKSRMHQLGDVITVHTGDIGTSAVIGENEVNSIGFATIVTRPNQKILDSNYFATYLNTDTHKQWAISMATGDGRSNYNLKDYTKLVVPIPQIEEQKKIATCIGNLNNLITLHQRKCEETKSLKKYMLQKMFPENGNCVPKIRFSGFADAWEQRKLDNVAEFSKGRGYSKGDLIELGTPIILYGRLYTNYETSISDVDTYVEAKDGSVYSRGGEVIVPASGESAEDIARAATVDKSGILLGGDLNVVMPNEDINSGFLAISISNGNPQRELAKRAQGKSVVHIHNEEIRNLRVPFPIKVEQNKIVEYFFNLDHLITLHQRKCYRFIDIVLDAWEQRKFGDLYCKVSEKNDLSFGSDKIISVANMYFKEDVKDSSEEYMRTYNVMRLGDIAFEGNKSKNYAHGRFVENTIGDGIVSHVFDVFRPIAEYDLYFWKYLINNEDVMGRIMTRCTKASTMMTNLVTNDFLKEEIMVPSLDEQRKIGKYLDDLDNLITLHQHKCDELQKLKKFMLQNMFV